MGANDRRDAVHGGTGSSRACGVLGATALIAAARLGARAAWAGVLGTDDVDVVDTTGCGHAFHGAYAAGLAFGLDLRSRVRLASAAGALAATRPGGQAGLPTRSDVEALTGERLPAV